MIISGRGARSRIVLGSGTIAYPVLEQIEFLSLRNRTITVTVREVLTQEAVPVYVVAVAQVKIGSDEAQIRAAAQRFLGQNDEEIHETILDTLGGHLRAIIAKMTAEQVYKDRDEFAKNVLDLSSGELGTLGFTIDSFVIREISDDNAYYDALGQEQIANVKRDADVATAEASRETRERTAGANLAARQAEITAETREAEAAKECDVATQGYRVDAEKATADANVAGPLQAAVRNEELAESQGRVEVVRQQQAALAAEVEVEVAKNRSEAETVIPAQGQADATKAAADAEAERIRLTREAAAQGTRAEGMAAAEVTRARLLAEAEGQEKLAEARASEDEINFRRDVVQVLAETKVKGMEALGVAMSDLGKGMRVVQFSGGGGGGENGMGTGNALLNAIRGVPRIVAEADEQVDALFGFSFSDMMRGRFGTSGSDADDLGGGADGRSGPDDPPERGGKGSASPAAPPPRPPSPPAAQTPPATQTRPSPAPQPPPAQPPQSSDRGPAIGGRPGPR